MIGQLTGTISSVNPGSVILDVHDVGYLVVLPPKLLEEARPGERKTYFIYTYVRDDAIELYGFGTRDQWETFLLLLGVSGIGPKTALAVTDRGTAGIRRAVATSDVDFFMSVPRLGRKNAQKIIIDLKSKLGSTTDLNLTDTGMTRDLVEALTGMGFDRREIRGIIGKIPGDLPISGQIRMALKYLGSAQVK